MEFYFQNNDPGYFTLKGRSNLKYNKNRITRKKT